MRIGVVGLPRYKPLKQMILDQFGATRHDFLIVEEANREFIDQGLGGLAAPPNVRWKMVPGLEPDGVVDALAGEGIARVTALSDRGAIPAGRARERLRLPGMREAQEAWVVDKAAMRRRLAAAGLTRIATAETNVDGLAETIARFELPVIVKPTRLGASICVERIDTPAAIPAYVERCRANRILNGGTLMIEPFVAGPELSVEGIVARGSIAFFGITESHTSGPPYYVGTGHDFFARHPERTAIEGFAARLIEALEMDDCPFHIELKIGAEGFETIEAHSRFGGAMIMQLVERAAGVRAFAMLADALAGDAPVVPLAATAGLVCEHLLPIGEGRVEAIDLPADLLAERRVVGHALDYAPGEVIEPNVLPVQYAGYVAFEASDRDDAARFRAKLDAGLLCRLEPLGGGR
ncbi:MAG TPA: ATP-grasp domain-containing protein [Allosphingosinicella sp.]|nr:ATP-grasp domain-containing protein [Allosphingosinicella sp.]